MSEKSENVMQENFKESVKTYIKLTDELNEIGEVVKEKKKQTRVLSEVILNYMKQNEKEVCDLGAKGTIMIKKRKQKETIKREYVEEILKNHMKQEQAMESAKEIFDKQNVKETEFLQRNVKPLD